VIIEHERKNSGGTPRTPGARKRKELLHESAESTELKDANGSWNRGVWKSFFPFRRKKLFGINPVL
jgi:hypothetical protein